MSYIKAETLTPLHIGNGRELMGNFEYLYFQQEKAVAVIDEHKVLEIIGVDNIDQWVGIINRKESLLDYLNKRKPGLLSADTAARTLPVIGTPPGVQNTIKEYIHSGNGSPLLPGSSLKGAIRTAYFAREVQENNTFDIGRAISFKAYNKRKQREELRFNDKKLTKRLIGEDPNHDYFRLLRVGDLHLKRTVCMLMQSLNEGKDGFTIKGDVSQFVECIPAGDTALGQIQIPEKLRERILERNYFPKKTKERFSPQDLVNTINQHTLKILGEEISKWKKAELPASVASFPEELRRIKTEVENCSEHECILRVGHGSGFRFMTGDWQHEALNDEWYTKLMDSLQKHYHRDYDYPKSRRLGYGGVPFGFLKLTFLSDEEYRQQLAEEAENEQEMIKQEQIRLKKAAQDAESEKQRQTEEEEARRKAAEEAEAAKQKAWEEKLAAMPKPVEGELKPGDVIEAEIYKIAGNYNTARYCPAPGEYSEQWGLEVGKKQKNAIPSFDEQFAEGALIKARVEILKKRNIITLHFQEFIDR